METATKQIYIIGAGISGLIAAKTLEENGLHPIIIETTDRPGGRVKTDILDGIAFDHGFQVLLTAYPQVQKQLDLDALHLHRFKPGALLFNNGKRQRIGDPLRDFSALWPTFVSSAGSWHDKFKIFKLSKRLKHKPLETIFNEPEITTLTYLKNYGFSDQIIRNFFKPFFTGIFLEEHLHTSSRMFEFVFKMFSEGYATLPKKGIGAVTEQLVGKLKNTTFKFNTKVQSVSSGQIMLSDGSSLKSENIITTTPLNTDTNITWKSCQNLYFKVKKQTFDQGFIGLITDDSALTNNLFYLFDTKKPVLSVTVVKEHELTTKALVDKVRSELQQHCGIEVLAMEKWYDIPKALPDILDVKLHATQSRSNNGLLRAGDYTLNGSLNAAMQSGETAAEQLLALYKERGEPSRRSQA